MREWAGKEDDQFAITARQLGYHPLAVKSVDWLNSCDINRVKSEAYKKI